MKSFIKLLPVYAVLMAGMMLAFVVTPVNVANAHDGEDHEEVAQESDESNNAYKYVAQSGDTYTEMARKAIQTYGIENSVNLSGAEIVYAETMLTQEAGSPQLNVGQEVTISKDTVKKWVDSARGLDDATEAKWNRYVASVDFNTNAVGESPTANV